jgi:MoxR-like ATPase
MTARDTILDLNAGLGRSIIGQEQVFESILIALLANGNRLVEGLPDLAKTRAIKALAKNLEQRCRAPWFWTPPKLSPSHLAGRFR